MILSVSTSGVYYTNMMLNKRNTVSSVKKHKTRDLLLGLIIPIVTFTIAAIGIVQQVATKAATPQIPVNQPGPYEPPQQNLSQ